MSESTIARRYAKALFDLSRDGDQVEAVRLELENFGSLAVENSELLDVLSNRFLDISGRLGLIDELGDRLGLSLSVSHFLKLLVKKGRISLLKLVVESFRRHAFDYQQITEVRLKSASPLDSSFCDQISSLLARTSGKKIILKHELDLRLLGGIWLKIGNEVYDGTVKADLEQLKNRMIQSAV